MTHFAMMPEQKWEQDEPPLYGSNAWEGGPRDTSGPVSKEPRSTTSEQRRFWRWVRDVQGEQEQQPAIAHHGALEGSQQRPGLGSPFSRPR